MFSGSIDDDRSTQWSLYNTASSILAFTDVILLQWLGIVWMRGLGSKFTTWDSTTILPLIWVELKCSYTVMGASGHLCTPLYKPSLYPSRLNLRLLLPTRRKAYDMVDCTPNQIPNNSFHWQSTINDMLHNINSNYRNVKWNWNVEFKKQRPWFCLQRDTNPYIPFLRFYYYYYYFLFLLIFMNFIWILFRHYIESLWILFL